MIIRSYLVTLWALLFVSCGPAAAQSVAVFDFELPGRIARFRPWFPQGHPRPGRKA